MPSNTEFNIFLVLFLFSLGSSLMCYVKESNDLMEKKVDCETYKNPDGELPDKGSMFCLTVETSPLAKTRSCSGIEENLLKIWQFAIPSLKYEEGCYDANVPGMKLCLCSTDECNSGKHKENIVVQLWALEILKRRYINRIFNILMTDGGPALTSEELDNPNTTDRVTENPKMTNQRGTSKGSTISKQAELSLEDPRTTDEGSKDPKTTHTDYPPDGDGDDEGVSEGSKMTTQRGTTKSGAISKQAELSLIVVPFVLVISTPDFQH